MLKNLLLAGGIIFSSPAFPISIVGNCGLSDPSEGFSVNTAPLNFRDLALISEGGVQLTGTIPKIGLSSVPTIERILIYPLSQEYPELAGLDRAAFKQHFINGHASWEVVAIGDPCVEILTVTNGNLRTTVAGWGKGHGIVIQSASDSPDIESAVDSLLPTIQLNSGACGW